MKTAQKPNSNRVSAKDDTAKPRRPETKTTPKPNSSRVSAKDDAAKPRRAVTKTSEKPSSRVVAARGDAPSSRREATRPADRSSQRGIAARGDAPSPRRTDSKTTTKPATSRGPAKAPAAQKAVEIKPRRVGTKLSRLLALNVTTVKTPVTAQENAAKPRRTETGNTELNQWLLYCRPGFEQDCAQEAVRQARMQRPVLAEQPDVIANSGYSVISLNDQPLSYSDLIFARQLIRLHHTIDVLPERDRLTPILTAIAALPGNFGALWLEIPDTNDGKTISAFTRRFQPLLEDALRAQGRLVDDIKLPRLHIFFPDKSSALIGTSDPYNSAASIMGIVRQSMPAEAPSRSTMKLAEAIEVFMDKGEQTRLLRNGMTAVDLGAAPGGWTWQMVRRGIRVTAVDNGPMKGVVAKHPLVEHLMQDGFKFAPRRAVDWLICDMVEKPAKVAELIGNWFASGWCKHAIFNLKLPMKQRVSALDAALGGIKSRLDMEGISYKMTAKQLYHDREEITVFLSKTKNR
jgi:23S rRNA (cytidine2498-2'-O)-methyltransferase